MQQYLAKRRVLENRSPKPGRGPYSPRCITGTSALAAERSRNGQQRQERAAIGIQQSDARSGAHQASHRKSCTVSPHAYDTTGPDSDPANQSCTASRVRHPMCALHAISCGASPPRGHRGCKRRVLSRITRNSTTSCGLPRWRPGSCEVRLPALDRAALDRVPLTNPVRVALARAAVELAVAGAVQLRPAAAGAGAAHESTRRRAPREPPQQPRPHSESVSAGPLFRKRRTSGPPWLKRP